MTSKHCRRYYAYICKLNNTEQPIKTYTLFPCGTNKLVFYDGSSNSNSHVSDYLSTEPIPGDIITIEGIKYRVTELITDVHLYGVRPPTVFCKKFWPIDIDPIKIDNTPKPFIPMLDICCLLLIILLLLLFFKFGYIKKIRKSIINSINKLMKYFKIIK